MKVEVISEVLFYGSDTYVCGDVLEMDEETAKSCMTGRRDSVKPAGQGAKVATPVPPPPLDPAQKKLDAENERGRKENRGFGK